MHSEKLYQKYSDRKHWEMSPTTYAKRFLGFLRVRVRRYTLKVHQFIEKQEYSLGGRFYADETMVDCEGRKDRFWCCLDWDTRLITGLKLCL